jgi:hypothetical protein
MVNDGYLLLINVNYGWLCLIFVNSGWLVRKSMFFHVNIRQQMEHWCSPISSDHVWDLRMEMHGFAVMELDIWKWLVNQHWVILSNITCCKATPNTIGFPTANHGGGASAHWLTGFSAAFLTRASVPCFRCREITHLGTLSFHFGRKDYVVTTM